MQSALFCGTLEDLSVSREILVFRLNCSATVSPTSNVNKYASSFIPHFFHHVTAKASFRCVEAVQVGTMLKFR